MRRRCRAASPAEHTRREIESARLRSHARRRSAEWGGRDHLRGDQRATGLPRRGHIGDDGLAALHEKKAGARRCHCRADEETTAIEQTRGSSRLHGDSGMVGDRRRSIAMASAFHTGELLRRCGHRLVGPGDR